MRGRANPVRYYKARRLQGLGAVIDPSAISRGEDAVANWWASLFTPSATLPNPVTAGGIATNIAAAGNSWDSLFIPSGGVPGMVFNAATGNVSPAQKQNLIAQQTQAMIAAGADPATAAAQANSDVTAVLTTYSGPGAFGVTTTGADPSQAWTAQLTNLLSTPDPTFGLPTWLWLAGGGFLIYLFAKR